MASRADSREVMSDRHSPTDRAWHDRIIRVARTLLALALLFPLSITNPAPTVPMACDADGDGDIDSNDLNLIAAARNQLAKDADDPRDPDRDGRITVIDLRICSLKCTRPNCATNSVPLANAGPD
jgi:hypothetical protein